MGSERSGRRPLGQAIVADELVELGHRTAQRFETRGLIDEGRQTREEFQAVIAHRETLRSKTALAELLLRDVVVSDGAKRLATEHRQTHGELLSHTRYVSPFGRGKR